MQDPTPLVDHVYETFVEMICNALSFGGLQRNIETDRRLRAQGKDMDSTNLFNTLYTETRVPLFGHALYNQFVYIKENNTEEGEIIAPSKLYMFDKVSQDDVSLTRFAQQNESDEAPECALWIQKPDAAATKSLLSTCCKISKRQPVTHLLIMDVTCEELTPAEVPVLSRNIQAICVINCDLPPSFWKKILHQLIDNVNLRSLWFTNTNLHHSEEDLDELFKNLDSLTDSSNHQVEVLLIENNFSEKFVKKWNHTGLGISCEFYNNSFHVSKSSEDDFNLDEINQLTGEQAISRKETNRSQEISSTELHFKLKGPAGNDRENLKIKGEGTKHWVHHSNSSNSTESSFSSGEV